MLELPEVITLSKQVNNALSGKTITQVFNATKPHKFTFYNGEPSEYGKLLVGKTILSSEGYGMFVNFNLSDNVIMNIGDGVSVRYYSAGDEIPANYQLLLTFNDDSFLVFTVAMYGFINVYSDSYIDNKYYKLSRESISPLSDKYTEAEFEKLVAEAKKTLSAKALLATNQHIPGVGNGVTQDILFNARINPKQKVLLLSDNQKEVLFNALKKNIGGYDFRGRTRYANRSLWQRRRLQNHSFCQNMEESLSPLWQYHHKRGLYGWFGILLPDVSTYKRINVHILLAPFMYDARN